MSDSKASSAAYGLAFETSGMQGSVALGRGAEILGAQAFTGPRTHAIEFLPAVNALCRLWAVTPSDIRWVYVSAGPGSFTGLRIGITAARIIAFATGARIMAVPTLEGIAQNALEVPDPPERVVVILDAKRSRVYAATFVRRDGRYEPETEPVEADPVTYLAERARIPADAGRPTRNTDREVPDTARGISPRASACAGAPVLFALWAHSLLEAQRGLERPFTPC